MTPRDLEGGPDGGERPDPNQSAEYQRGYRAGWDDREGDLLAGLDRIHGLLPTSTLAEAQALLLARKERDDARARVAELLAEVAGALGWRTGSHSAADVLAEISECARYRAHHTEAPNVELLSTLATALGLESTAGRGEVVAEIERLAGRRAGIFVSQEVHTAALSTARAAAFEEVRASLGMHPGVTDEESILEAAERATTCERCRKRERAREAECDICFGEEIVAARADAERDVLARVAGVIAKFRGRYCAVSTWEVFKTIDEVTGRLAREFGAAWPAGEGK